jgi:hypothetical protein
VKIRVPALALFVTAFCHGQYTYEFSCAWADFGQQACGSEPLGAWDFWPALMSYSPVTGNPNDYEIKTQLAIKSSGGLFVHLLRASFPATLNGLGNGTYVAPELSVPANFQTTGPATLYIMQCINGSVTQLASTAVTATDGMTMRSVIWGNSLWVYLDNVLVLQQTVSVTSGVPGVAGSNVSGGSQMSTLQIGHHDTTPPTISAQGIATSVFPTSVSVRWPGASDDPNGVGIYQYKLTSSGGTTISTTDKAFTDTSVAPLTTYSYTLQAMDFHGNWSTPTQFSVTTPPVSAVDPRRVGTYSTGSYWGGGGEQIDTLSGNVNFSIPLLTPRGRTGWTVPLGLSYNSQNWRQDNSVNWMLGADVGYGFGWRLSFGSITPFYTTTWSGVDHYLFTDSSGAEYRLDQNSNGIWSSRQGIYVWFDSNTNILHFKSGTFWVMGSTSGGDEPDAGSMYPTIIEDVSGHQVLIRYQPGSGLAGVANTSARISAIEDVRAWQCVSNQNWVPNSVNCPTYVFSYNNDSPIPHITGISNTIQTAENYNFGFNFNVAVQPPFGSDPNFNGIKTAQLTSVNVISANAYQFAYDSAGAQELTQVTFPFGGHLRWIYANDAFTGSRVQRAISTRYLAADSGGLTEWAYPFTRDNASAATLHAWTSLVDASGVGSKTWSFIAGSGAPAWQLGLLSELVQKNSLNGSAILQDDAYVWSQEPTALNPYISAKTTVMDAGSANQQSALTTQTIDQYGNVTQLATYPYNNTTAPLRTYNNTYLNDAAHTSHYVFDRLVTSTITTGGVTKTLAQNSYDTSGLVTLNGQNFHYGNFAYSAIIREMDPNPAPLSSQGVLVSTTTQVHTVSYSLSNGILSGSAPTDGQITTVTTDNTTNYAAPQTIALQTFSQNVAYNSWLGITQTATVNGVTLSTTYDSIGRPATSRDPFSNYMNNGPGGSPPTYTYAYSNAGIVPLQQTKTGYDGVTITTLDGLGRTIRVERGPGRHAHPVGRRHRVCALRLLAARQARADVSAVCSRQYSGVDRLLL